MLGIIWSSFPLSLVQYLPNHSTGFSYHVGVNIDTCRNPCIHSPSHPTLSTPIKRRPLSNLVNSGGKIFWTLTKGKWELKRNRWGWIVVCTLQVPTRDCWQIVPGFMCTILFYIRKIWITYESNVSIYNL